MTEEIKEVIVEKTPEVELNEVEQTAYAKGWRPKEEYDGDPEDWVPAEIYEARAPLMKHIKKLKNEFETYKQRSEGDLKAVIDHHNRFRDVELQRLEQQYKTEIETLKNKKAEAIEAGRGDLVVEIDDQIDQRKDAIAAQKAVAAAPGPRGPTPEFSTWLSENSWYNQDQELHQYADQIGFGFKASKPTATNEEMLAHVSKMVKKTYPEKFENPNRRAAPTVEGGTAPTRRSNTNSVELSDEETRAMKVFMQRIPGYTKEKYLAEIKKTRGA